MSESNPPPPNQETAHAHTVSADATREFRPAHGEAVQTGVQVQGYRILGVLGRGGMGIVYKAVQEKANRLVALKMILGGAHANPADHVRFLAEAEAVARLSHPHIVQLYEVGETPEGLPFFSLEFVAGGTLAHRLRAGPMKATDAAVLIEALAGAMQCAHEQNIVHRDLKPSNILLTAESRQPTAVSKAMIIASAEDSALKGLSDSLRGNEGMPPTIPKISDFGLAKQLDALDGMTRTGEIVGTATYMAPEQAFGQSKNVGPAADIYSLGVILYECLTGRPPFRGASAAETLAQVRTMEPIAVRAFTKEIPRDLETICLKCLAKDPRRRYASAALLADDLQRFLSGRPIAARPVRGPERVWRWCRRNPVPTALIASLLLGSLLAVGLSVWALRERDRADLKAREAGQNATRAGLLAQQEASQRSRAEKELARSLLSQVREMSATAPPGWTWKGLDALDKAQKLQTSDLDPVELRSLIADCLGRPDIRKVGVLADQMDPSTVAFGKDGELLAVAEKKNAVQCSIRIFNVATRRLTATCTFPTLAGGLGKLVVGDGRYQDGVVCAAFSPDGKWLVAGTRHGKVCRWDVTEANPKLAFLQLRGETQAIECLAFAPDGTLLIGGSASKTMRWDLADNWKGSVLWPRECFTAAFTPNGETLAVVADGVVKLFVGKDLLPRKTIPQNIPAVTLAISPNGRTLATQNGADLRLIDLQDARVSAGWRLEEDGVTPSAHRHGLHFNADGSILVVAGMDHRVRLWDVASGKKLGELFVADRQDPIPALSQDGRYLALPADRRTLLYELRSAEIQATIARRAHPVNAIALAHAGKTLLCSSERKISEHVVEENVTSWHLPSGQRQRSFRIINLTGDKIRFGANRGGLAAQGPWIVHASSIIGGRLIALEKRHAGMPVMDVPGSEPGVDIPRGAFTFIGTGVEEREDRDAWGGTAIRIPGKSPGAGIRFRIPDACRNPTAEGWLIGAAVRVEQGIGAGPAFDFSLLAPPDQRWRRSATAPQGTEGDYHLWLCECTDVKGQAKLGWLDASLTIPEKTSVKAVWVDRFFLIPLWKRELPARVAVQRLEFPTLAPNADRLWGLVDAEQIVSWQNPALKQASRWSDAAGAALFGHARTNALAVGKTWVLAGTERGEAMLLSAATGQREGILRGPPGAIRALALDPTEALCAVGTQKGHLRLLGIPGSKIVADLPRHAQSVESLSFSRDGQLLVTGALDQSVRLWRRAGPSYELLLALKVPTGQIASVRLSPDNSKLIVLAEPERAVRVWHLDRLKKHLDAIGLGW